MCDTYDANCEEPGCDKTLPYHLPDFSVPRSAVHVRCRKHAPPLGRGWTKVTWTVDTTYWENILCAAERAEFEPWLPYYLLVDGVPDPLGAGHGVNDCLDEEGELW